jgi:hypothetical protein
MRRKILIVNFAALIAIAGCGKKDADAAAVAAAAAPDVAATAPEAVASTPPVEEAWPETFMRPSVDFAGVYDMGVAGKTVEIKIISSGDDQRLAFPPGMGPGGPAGAWSQIVLNQDGGAKTYMWPEGEGAPAIATTMSRGDLGAAARAFGVDPADEARAKRTGTDEVAGEKCAVWEVAPATDAEAAGSACIARDGVMLRASSGGQTVMEAKSITRGPQDPALFAPPAGYEIVDMGECMRMSAEMMAAVRAGKTPDMAKMEKCAALGEKMGAMYGRQ